MHKRCSFIFYSQLYLLNIATSDSTKLPATKHTDMEDNNILLVG